MVHVAAVLLEGEVVDPLTLLHRPEREQRHDLRLAAGEERGAVRARADLHLAETGRISSSERPSGRRLSTAIFLRTRSL